MSKKKIDRHVDPPQVSFTFLVDSTDIKKINAIAKGTDRTRGSVVREALRDYLKSNKA